MMKFNKQTNKILFLSTLYLFILINEALSQDSELFSGKLNLNAELSFDFKELYKDTNDSTFIKSSMIFSGKYATLNLLDLR